MVEIWLKSSAQPLKREGVKNVYEKGSYTCIQLEYTVEKYPTADVFRVIETYNRAALKYDSGRNNVMRTDVNKGSREIKIDVVEKLAGVKLSAKGREYVGVLLQLNHDLNSIATAVRNLAEYFELSEG